MRIKFLSNNSIREKLVALEAYMWSVDHYDVNLIMFLGKID
jgi:hypothetical protein